MLFMFQGHHAVLAFFVLSGYFVGGSILRDPGFRWRPYLLKRLVRLWSVLIPALAFAALVGLAVVRLYPNTPEEAFRIQGSWPGPYDFTWTTLGLNLAFLQKIVSPVFANDGPLWSLSYEFWYYLLFPALLLGWRSRHRRLFFLALALALAGSLALPLAVLKDSVEPFVAWFLVWFMGCVVYLLEQRRPQGFHLGLLARTTLFVALLGCAMVPDQILARLHLWLPTKLIELWVGASFAALVWLMVVDRNLNLPPALGRAGAFLSKSSYSLYLTHFPVIILIGYTFYGDLNRAINWSTLAQLVVWTALLMANGWLFWRLFESRTDWVRGKVAALLGWDKLA
jgi:peptidoglycan/LPS O-acetylase OafA/YrhL